MKKLIALAFALAVVATVFATAFVVFGTSDAEAKNGPKNFVVVLQGTAEGRAETINEVDNICFDVDLVDPSTDRRIGSGTDCLALGTFSPIGVVEPTSLQGFRIVNTTFFNLPGGQIVSRSLTTIQPVHPDEVDPVSGPTHITGEVGQNDNILSGTGRFGEVSGSTRLSGAVDLRDFTLAAGSPITFDCIFVIDLN